MSQRPDFLQRALVLCIFAALSACNRSSSIAQRASQPQERTTGTTTVVESAPPPASEPRPNGDQTDGDDATAAVDVVRNYYRAISARDFERAYHYWGEGGPPGQDQATFAKGFERTASVEVTTGTPSRVEGAAGSRYVEVPVVVTATTTTGEVQRFEGTYTLRRSVVDGASAAQRAWHLHRASIRATKRQ